MVVAVALLCGCPYYSITADDALENLYYQKPFLRDEPSGQFEDFHVLADAVSPRFLEITDDGYFEPRDPKRLRDLAGCADPVLFLHLSDAQVRDETLFFDTKKLDQVGFWDWVVPVSQRRPNVETEDSLTLASFLVAQGKESKSSESIEPRPFVVHTGDLLDVSATSELMETLSIFSHVKSQYRLPIFSLGGNHDGLTFGNIADRLSDTRGLGVNRAEFVVGHLVADRDPTTGLLPDPRAAPDAGFGFAGNEIVQSALRNRALSPGAFSLPDSDACDATCWARTERLFRRIGELQDRSWDIPLGSDQAPPPVLFQTTIHVPAEAELLPIHIGYYSWSRAGTASQPPVRFVALDTRGENQANGEIDDVQLLWLYDQLARAFRARELVIVFAHHHPSDVRSLYVLPSRGGSWLESLVDGFPNVVAYFHGHSHWNEPEPGCIKGGERPFYVETGSLADYPQVGRQVAVCASNGRPDPSITSVGGGTATIAWTFVRPVGIHPTGPTSGVRQPALQEQMTASEQTPVEKLTGEVRGALLSSLLTASQSDAEKEFRQSHHWWWEFQPVAHWFFPWWIPPFVTFDEHAFRRTALVPTRVAVEFDFEADACPSAEAIFGKSALDEIQSFRAALRLPAALTRCSSD